jgi:hypothetical protein
MSVSGPTESSVLAELTTVVRRRNAKTKNLPGTAKTISFVFFMHSASEYTDSRRTCSCQQESQWSDVDFEGGALEPLPFPRNRVFAQGMKVLTNL